VLATGTGTQILDNSIHHNGQLGVAGPSNTSLQVIGNEVDNNNTDGFWISDWEAGGIKVTRSSATIQHNNVHDNKSVGIWLDIDNKGVTIDDNSIVNNAADGIRYEISYDGVISNNVVTGNSLGLGRGCNTSLYCGAGIDLDAATNVEIFGNTVKDNMNGISLQGRNRGAGAYGTWSLSNVYVHDNVITMSRGLTGLVQNVGDDSYFTSKNNRFVHNTYHLDTLGAVRFAWMNATGSRTMWVGYGQDVSGSFLSP